MGQMSMYRHDEQRLVRAEELTTPPLQLICHQQGVLPDLKHLTTLPEECSFPSVPIQHLDYLPLSPSMKLYRDQAM